MVVQGMAVLEVLRLVKLSALQIYFLNAKGTQKPSTYQ